MLLPTPQPTSSACVFRRLTLILIVASTTSTSALTAENSTEGPAAEFFEKKIRPLLVQHCVECHGPENQEGSLRLDIPGGIKSGGISGPVLVPGLPDQSRLKNSPNALARSRRPLAR